MPVLRFYIDRINYKTTYNYAIEPDYKINLGYLLFYID